MAYEATQIYSIVNDAAAEALGQSASLTKIETTDFVSLGKAIDAHNAYEGFYGSLVNRLTKTVYFIRVYEGSKRNVLRDENEYGAFIQKVYYEMPTAVTNATYTELLDGEFTQASPYDVKATVGVSSLVYGGRGTWSIEIVRPIEQIKTAFLSEAAMMAFIDGIYVAIENSMKVDEEALVNAAVNTSIASSLKGGIARNLLGEYDAMVLGDGANVITSLEAALQDRDFLKYASKEINLTVDNMSVMSAAYNKAGYTTFTNKDNLVVEMLSHFASASDMYLQADTFHNELTKLPNFEKVPYWQRSGKNFLLADCSSIDVENDALIDSTDESDTGEVVQSGILAFVRDIENVAAYFGNRRSWEMVNPRSEVVIHGEKADKGYAVDDHANAVVFYAEAPGTLTLSYDSSDFTVVSTYTRAYEGLEQTLTVTGTVTTITATGAKLTKVSDGVYKFIPEAGDVTITIA